MYSRNTARAMQRRGSSYFTTEFESTSAGFLVFRLESGEIFPLSHGFGRDHIPERKRDSSPSEIECRTRFIVSR